MAFLLILDYVFARLARRSNPYPRALRYDLTPSVLKIQEERRQSYTYHSAAILKFLFSREIFNWLSGEDKVRVWELV